jgi:hypothetical protein
VVILVRQPVSGLTRPVLRRTCWTLKVHVQYCTELYFPKYPWDPE